MSKTIVFDTETTGFSHAKGDKVISFGAVHVETGEEVEFFINPGKPIPKAASDIHGITDEMVKDAPSFAEVAPKIVEMLQGARIVAHNASFDVRMLDGELAECGFDKIKVLAKEVVDTRRMAERIAKDKENTLDALASKDRYDSPLREQRDKHGALIDAKILADIFPKLEADFLQAKKDTETKTGISVDLENIEFPETLPELIQMYIDNSKVIADITAVSKQIKALIESKTKGVPFSQDGLEVVYQDRKTVDYKKLYSDYSSRFDDVPIADYTSTSQTMVIRQGKAAKTKE